MNDDGFVYVICGTKGKAGERAEIVYKIGWSATLAGVEKRLASFKTGCPYNLHVFQVWAATRAEEKALHRRFAKYRLAGEWFESSPELVHYLSAGLRAALHENEPWEPDPMLACAWHPEKWYGNERFGAVWGRDGGQITRRVADAPAP